MNTFYTIKELEKKVGEKERKLRYWMQECALESKRIPGQKAYYSQETLDRLKFIKKVLDFEYEPAKGNFKPTLAQLKDFLERLSMEQIRDVLEDIEPLEVGYLESGQDGEPVIRTLKNEVLPLDSSRYGDIVASHTMFSLAPKASEPTQPVRESALDYLTQITSQPPEPKPRKKLQKLSLGKDLELRHRKGLTPHQEQQLKLVGKLIQSILSKEK